MKKQTKYFINGIVLLILALLSVTVFPVVLKVGKYANIEQYIYVEFEFFLLAACALFFLFAPKYHNKQIIAILLGIIYYLFFVLVYPFLF